jgi:hypothetical protein
MKIYAMAAAFFHAERQAECRHGGTKSRFLYNSPNAPNRKYGDGVFTSGINFITGVMKMHQVVRKLNWGHANSAW